MLKYTMWVRKKGNPGLTSNFSKVNKDTKLISVHDSIIRQLRTRRVLLSYTLYDCALLALKWRIIPLSFAISFFSWMAAELYILQNMSKKFQVGVVCATWCHLWELSQQSNNHASALHCILQLKTWMKTVLTCFKNYCGADIPDPIWTTNVPHAWKKNKHAIIH